MRYLVYLLTVRDDEGRTWDPGRFRRSPRELCGWSKRWRGECGVTPAQQAGVHPAAAMTAM